MLERQSKLLAGARCDGRDFAYGTRAYIQERSTLHQVVLHQVVPETAPGGPNCQSPIQSYTKGLSKLRSPSCAAVDFPQHSRSIKAPHNALQKMPATMHFQKVHQLPLATTKRRLPRKRCRRQCISKRYISSFWPPQSAACHAKDAGDNAFPKGTSAPSGHHKAPPAMQKMLATMHFQKVHQLPLATTKRRLPCRRCRRQCISKRYISSLWPPQSAAQCIAKDAGDNAFLKGTSAPSGHHKAPPATQKMPATMHFQKVHQLLLATTKRRLPRKRCRRQCISKRYISSLWPPQSAACHAKDAGDNAFPKGTSAPSGHHKAPPAMQKMPATMHFQKVHQLPLATAKRRLPCKRCRRQCISKRYISSLWPPQSAACHAKDAGDNAFPKGTSAFSGDPKAPPATQKMPATMHFQKVHQLPLATTKRCTMHCKRCRRQCISKRYISSLWPPQSAAQCIAKDAGDNAFPKGTSAPSGHHKAPPATQKMPATMHFQKVHQLPLATTKRRLPRKRCRRQCISKRYISSLWPPQSPACHAKDAGDNAFPKGTSAPSGHHKAPPATQKMPATMHFQKVHQLPLATTKRRPATQKMPATMHFQKVHQLPLATTKRRLPCKRCRRQCISKRYISSLWPPRSAACHAKDAGDNAFPKGTSAPSRHHKAPPAMQKMPATMHFQKVHQLPLATTKRRLPCKSCRRQCISKSTSAPSGHHKAPPAMQKLPATMHFQKVHQLPLATTKRRLPCKSCRRQCISKRYISSLWPPQSAACHAKDTGNNVFPKGTSAPSCPPQSAACHAKDFGECIFTRYISSLWPPQSAACHAEDAGDNVFPQGTSAPSGHHKAPPATQKLPATMHFQKVHQLPLATTKRRLPCKRCRRQCISKRYINSLWPPQSAACHAKDAGDNAFPKGASAPSGHHKAPPAMQKMPATMHFQKVHQLPLATTKRCLPCKRCRRQCISKRYISSLWPPQGAVCHAKDSGDNVFPKGTSAPSGHHKAPPAMQKMPVTMHFQKVHQLPHGHHKAPPAMQKMPATVHFQKVHQLPLATTKRRLPRKRCRRQCISKKVHQLPLATTKRCLPCKRCRRQCISKRYISSLWPPQSAAQCIAKDAGDNAFPKGTSAPSGHHKAPPATQKMPATMHFQKVHQLPLATTKRRLPCKRCRRQCISKKYISSLWPPQSAACHAKDAGDNAFPKGTSAPSGHHKAPPAMQKMTATMHFQKVHQLPLATTKRRLPCKRCRRQCISKRYISSLWPPQSAVCHAKDAGDNVFPKGTSAPSGHHKAPPAMQKMPATMHFQKVHQLPLATTKRRTMHCKRCRRQCISKRYISSLWPPQSAACHAKDASDNAFPKGTSAPSGPPQSAACHAKDAGNNVFPKSTSAPSGHHKAPPAMQKMPATMNFQKVHQLPLATTKRRLPCKRCRRQCISKIHQLPLATTKRRLPCKRCRRQCISKWYISSLWPPQSAASHATMYFQKVHQPPLATTKRRLPCKRCQRQCISKRRVSSLWPPQSAASHATMYFQKVHQLPLATTKRRLPCKRCQRQRISKRYISSI